MRVPKLVQTIKPSKLPKPKFEPKTIALTADSLERLGAARLAQLVLELSAGSAVIKRRLKIELSGPDGAGRGIAKRLATIAKSKSYIDWRKVRVVHGELMDQRAAIMTLVAPSDLGAALELMWCQQQSKIVPCGGVKVYQSGFEKRAIAARFVFAWIGV